MNVSGIVAAGPTGVVVWHAEITGGEVHRLALEVPSGGTQQPCAGVSEGVGSPHDALVANRLADHLRAWGTDGSHHIDVPFACGAPSPFARRVYAAVSDIAAGSTATYAEVARVVGVPQGSRAVGQALGANRLLLVVPCHRVVRSDGHTGGYVGGAELKRWMLDHEATSAARCSVQASP